MEYRILSSIDYKKTKWSGGTTTELFIYPEQSEFKSGEYDFRLSIATVEIEETTFTKLEEVTRTLMILDGQITLSHDGHHESRLKKFESDQFSGDWTTKGRGTCTDFNLMTKNQTSGKLTPIINKKFTSLKLNPLHQFTFLYLLKGLVNTRIEDHEFQINQGDLLMVQSPIDTSISLSSDASSELIRVDIK